MIPASPCSPCSQTVHPAAEAIEHNMVARWRPGDHEDMDPELRPVDGGWVIVSGCVDSLKIKVKKSN
jgi:hypothetical protein